MRARWITASVVLSLLLLVTPGVLHAQSQAPGPIVVGWMAPLTGPLAGLGEFYTAGAQLAFEGVGYQVAGRQLRWIQEDSEAKPDVGLTKARKLIERDRVHMLLGVISTSVALAIRQYVLDKGTPWIATEASGSVFEPVPGANIFRVSPDERGYMHPDALRHILKRGYKRLIMVGMDYSAGKDYVNSFTKKFGENGGQVVQTVLAPLGVPDYGPYLPQLRLDQADAVLGFVWGADANRFVRQFSEFGLKGKIPLLMLGPGVEDGVALPAQGETALGIINWYDYAVDNPIPENRRFVEGFQKKTGKLPSMHASKGYRTAQVAIEAIKAVGGAVEDLPRFLDAIRRVKFVSPSGPFSFDERQNAITNLYIREVRRVDGRIQNVTLDVIPGVKTPY